MRHIDARCYIVSRDIYLPYKQPRSSKPLLDSVLAACTGAHPLNIDSILVINNGACADESPYRSEGVRGFEDLLDSHKGQTFNVQEQLNPHDTINLQFTSGTTSSPKAVALSHWNILNNANIAARVWGTTQRDVYVCTMPLYHCGGIVAVVLAAMTHGAMISLPCEAFNALLTLHTIKEDRCTVLHGVPTMFLAWFDLLSLPEFRDHDFSHIRSGLVGAAPILPSLRKTLNQQLYLEDVGNTYGMTETCPVATMLTPSDPLDKKYNTVGRAMPHQTVRIAARDDPRRTLRVGDKGEILVAGMIMQRYWDDPERTIAATAITTSESGGKMRWMRTGDEGVMDADGFVTVTGRIKDIIIRGGENIYPPEIEDVVMQCAGVKSVAVVGLPDEKYGEVVAAFVVATADASILPTMEGDSTNTIDLRSLAEQSTDGTTASLSSTAEALRTWTRASLSGHLVPKHILWVDELPLTPTGKVEKHKLRDRGITALTEAKDRLAKSEQVKYGVSRPAASLKRPLSESEDVTLDAQQGEKKLCIAAVAA